MDRPQYESARRLVSRDLAIEITHSKWGDEERSKRLSAEDPRVQLAMRLLREATDSKSLFAIASAYAAENGAVVPEGTGARAVTPPRRR